MNYSYVAVFILLIVIYLFLFWLKNTETETRKWCDAACVFSMTKFQWVSVCTRHWFDVFIACFCLSVFQFAGEMHCWRLPAKRMPCSRERNERIINKRESVSQVSMYWHKRATIWLRFCEFVDKSWLSKQIIRERYTVKLHILTFVWKW